MRSSMVGLALAALLGVAAAEESLCARLEEGLSEKAERMAEACEGRREDCAAIAKDYHLHVDTHRSLCLVASANASTAAPTTAPRNVTTTPVQGNSTVAPTGPPGPPCANGGRQECRTAHGGCTCICRICWTGPRCTERLVRPYCANASTTAAPSTPAVNLTTTTAVPANASTTTPAVVNASTTAAPHNATCPPCLNGGSPLSGCRCICLDCFWGLRCQNAYSDCQKTTTTTPAPQPCQPNPCLNGGTGIPNGDRCECVCAQGFYGVNCGKAVPKTTTTTTAVPCHCVRKILGFCLKYEPKGCHKRLAVDSLSEEDPLVQLCLSRPHPAQQADCLRMIQQI